MTPIIVLRDHVVAAVDRLARADRREERVVLDLVGIALVLSSARWFSPQIRQLMSDAPCPCCRR